MKKIAVLFLLMAITGGCSKYNDNKITINNMSDGPIYFNFRAASYTVPVDNQLTITKIPNGTYTYATTYGVPPSATSWSVNGEASGDLSFNWEDTQILFVYSSVLADSTYTLGVTVTSSMSTSTHAITGN